MRYEIDKIINDLKYIQTIRSNIENNATDLTKDLGKLHQSIRSRLVDIHSLLTPKPVEISEGVTEDNSIKDNILEEDLPEDNSIKDKILEDMHEDNSISDNVLEEGTVQKKKSIDIESAWG